MLSQLYCCEADEIGKCLDWVGNILFSIETPTNRSDSPYHEYAKLKRYKKPDLAVAFHSGHTQEAQAEWLPTIKHLVGAGHATLFTSYNKAEMSEENSNLENMGAHFIQKGEINK